MHASCHRRIGLSLTLIACVVQTAGAADRGLTANALKEYRHGGPCGMRLPTDVAVAPNGDVYVADGLNDRVLRFDSSGNLIAALARIGDHALSRPIAVHVDERGRLWIADTGHACIVVCGSDGALERVLKPTVSGKHPLDITDLATTDDGKFVWLIDNDNHQLLRMDVQNGETAAFGRQGESLGELNHPFMMARKTSGEIFITDVINGRVAQFSASGMPARALAAYGVQLGQLYRPKGILCDKGGRIWVSDSVLGVIQVFTADGVLIDVLRDSTGAVLHLDSPMGMAFDADENLYVAEMTADRVRGFRIDRNEPQPVPARRTPPEIVGAAGRACTVCHIEMIEPLSRGVATEIARLPATSEAEPAVSRAESCLSCHDGSIVDSRRRVWQLHGHATGITPPEGMTVPSNLPLVNGTIACRTCHSAHVGGQFTADMSEAVFLRVPNRASELCISCHVDKTRGPKLGTHPIGGMPWPVPQALIDAGARVGPNPRELTCQVCHTPHGAVGEHLLVRGTESNQLCLSCHDQMRPGMFRDGGHTEHPISPVVNAAQAAAVKEMGTKLGPGEHLICLSCHKLHHGKGERFMLADDLTDGRFCIRCHQEKTSVVQSSHDLRVKFPEERNRLGMTASSGGPCSSCHMFHRYARTPEDSTLDPSGKCITCHQQGRCAESRTLGSVNHPQTKCTDCHDPHMRDHPMFLREAPGQVCSQCHTQQAAVAGGPHDSTRNAGAWPAESTAIRDACLACHRPHGNEDTGLFRMAGALGGVDAGCRACHASNAWDAHSNKAAVHPPVAIAATASGCLPLEEDPASGAFTMACKTCHDPHASGAGASKLLRVEAGGAARDLCLSCHTDMSHIAMTGHAGTSLAQAGLNAVACGPCHNVHANSANLASRFLLAIDPPGAGSAPSSSNAGSSICISCHRQGGPAKAPVIASHPEIAVPMAAVAGATSGLPLYDKNGLPSSSGFITCQTCHLPHGDAPPASRADASNLTAGERRAMRLLLRDFAPPNLCTSCHGSDGLRRFLYFHNPERRRGPITPPSADPVLTGGGSIGVSP